MDYQLTLPGIMPDTRVWEFKHSYEHLIRDAVKDAEKAYSGRDRSFRVLVDLDDDLNLVIKVEKILYRLLLETTDDLNLTLVREEVFDDIKQAEIFLKNFPQGFEIVMDDDPRLIGAIPVPLP